MVDAAWMVTCSKSPSAGIGCALVRLEADSQQPMTNVLNQRSRVRTGHLPSEDLSVRVARSWNNRRNDAGSGWGECWESFPR